MAETDASIEIVQPTVSLEEIVIRVAAHAAAFQLVAMDDDPYSSSSGPRDRALAMLVNLRVLARHGPGWTTSQRREFINRMGLQAEEIMNQTELPSLNIF